MLRLRSGQSVAEYLIVISLVGLAIIIGGPVLKRSLFGSLKLQEDTVMDSFSEAISQPASTSVTSCSCGAWQSLGCGDQGCLKTQIYRYRTCTPLDCLQERKCEGNASCCDPANGIQKLSCGTLVNANDPNADVPLSPTRGPVSSLFTAFKLTDASVIPPITAIDGTIYINSVDQKNCAIGERMISLTCGVPPANPTDPKQIGSSEQVVACEQAPLLDCRPGCGGLTAPQGTPCNTPPAENEYGRNGNNLNLEVAYRKRGGVITGTTTTLDLPDRRLNIATDYTSNPLTSYELSTPYQPPGNPDIDNTIYIGAYMLPWTYFDTVLDCNSSSIDRKCERVCPANMVPSSDRTYCVTPKCNNIVYKDSAQAQAVGGRMSFLTPKLDAPANFRITMSALNMSYIVGCFDGAGNLIDQKKAWNRRSDGPWWRMGVYPYPNALCYQTLGNPAATPPTSTIWNPPFIVSGKPYCLDTPNNSLDPMCVQPPAAPNPLSCDAGANPNNCLPITLATNTATVSCVGASQVFVWIFNGAPTVNPADTISYQIDYQKQNNSVEVELLTDNQANVFQSYQPLLARGSFLYQAPPVANNYGYPMGYFTALPDPNGNVYLWVEHANTDASFGGVSLKQRKYDNTGMCFREVVATGYSTPPGTPNGNIAPGSPWYDNDCWTWSTAALPNNLRDTVVNPHIVKVSSGLPGGACCPICANPNYCVSGACTCVPDCWGKCGVVGNQAPDGCGGFCPVQSCEAMYCQTKDSGGNPIPPIPNPAMTCDLTTYRCQC